MTNGPGASVADQKGFCLSARPGSVVDIYFDEQRIFSSPPARFSVEQGIARLDWPKILRQHLSGRTRLVVKEHLSGKVLLDEAVQFGDSTEPISVTDRQGRPLAVDKFGALVRMFTETDRSTAHHLATEVARLADDVNAFGVVGFLAYGSLLGAVRNGKLIGHDTDTDMAYLSNFSHPADIARESFALERFLLDRGWTMDRMRVGLIRAVFADRSGDHRHIDIFVAWHDGTRFYLNPFVEADLPRSALAPLTTVTLEGVDIPAPADTHAVLAAIYGASYLVPDPSFAYRPPRAVKRLAYAWMGNYRYQRGRWQHRMIQDWPDNRPGVTDFARWVSEREPPQATVVDVGCGMGGDALWFARNGHRVIGIDYASAPLANLRRIAARRGLPAEFREVSLYDVRSTLAAGAMLAGEPDGALVMYSRHLLDVMQSEGRVNFWLLARTVLLRGGRLYLRFRTERGRADAKEPGFRALDPGVIEAESRARGARVLSREDTERATTLVLTWS